MRAAMIRRHGPPEVLELTEVIPPETPSGGVRIRVCACALNYADLLLAKGSYQATPALPFVPGLEVAGEVLEVAPDVGGIAPGDRIAAIVDHGGMAEQVIARADDVYPLPDTMDFETAAAVPVAYGTSHLALSGKAQIRAGETLLVHGAAGGVGLTAVEIGKRLGATVIAGAGGPDKLAVAKKAGADHLLDYRKEDLREAVLNLTNGLGVDVVYDPVGGKTWEASLRAVKPGARMLVVGFAAGEVQQIPANILLVKNVTAIGFDWGAHRKFAPAQLRASLEQCFSWCADGVLAPRVSARYPLEKARQALEDLAARKTTGKLVLIP